MLRRYLTLGVVTATGATPFNPGLPGPLGLQIGPLPAEQMPGEIAKTIPVMANFHYLLGLIAQLVPTIPPFSPFPQVSFVTALDESGPLPQSRRLAAGPNIVITDGGPSGPITIAATSGGGGGGGGGLPRFFGPDPPLNPAAWLDWWNTEEGALKVYYTDVDTAQWVDAMPARTGAPGAVSPLSVKGDIWGFSTVDAKIPVGANGLVLTADSTDPLGVSWQAGGSTSPLTTKGDLYGFSTLDARLPVGADGTFLIADSGAALGVSWQSPAFTSPLTTKGDVLGFSTLAARVPVGSNTQVLTADSAQALGVKWATPTTGTVTSVAMTMPTGWTVTGSPITTAGTLAITGGPDASFLTLGLSADLANERVLTAGTNITFNDTGAGGTLTINAATGAGSPLTTKGDLYGFDSANARIPIGTNGDVLTADSAQALGLKWAAPTVYAPVGAQYVTLATDATLTSERVLTAGANITLTDNGAGSTVVVAATGTGAGSTAPGICNGRLTLQSGVAVPVTDQTAKTAVLWTPYKGAQMALFDGAAWNVLGCAETTLALGTLAAAFQAYDVFAFDNSGTMNLESLEWLSGTATMTVASPCVVTWTGAGVANGNSVVFTTSGALPTGLAINTQYYAVGVAGSTFNLATAPNGTAINTSGSQSGTHTAHGAHARATALVLQDGVYCKTGDTTRRYLGTFFSTSTTTTEDSAGAVTTNVGGKRFLWNYYNRLVRPLGVIDTANSWTYSTAAYRQANGNAGNMAEAIIGVAEANISVHVQAAASANAAVVLGVGVGVDAVTTNSAQFKFGGGFSTLTTMQPANYFGFPTAGYHSYRWLEYGSASTTCTWYGDNGGTPWQTGMYAERES